MVSHSRRSDCTPEIVEFLQRPEHYPGRPRHIEVIETHFAWVFLTESHAYKLKKSVFQDSMDYRTLAARGRGCRNELRLNRRLAKTVYLSVVPVTCRRDGTIMLGRHAKAPVIDWLVKMRRLPAPRMLDRAILERDLHARELKRLALRLSRFFDEATPRPMRRSRYIERLHDRTLENRRALCAPDLALDRLCIEKAIAMQLAFVARHESLLGDRAVLLIEGHGDLRPEHLYLGSRSDEPCVIDCLEFDPDLRRLDPAEEMAFLALECRRLGANAVAEALLSEYRKNTKAPPAQSLLHFYMSQRALIRAKLAAWHLRDPQFAPRAAFWRSRAASYLADAARYIQRAGREAMLERSSALRVNGPPLEQWSDRFTRQHAPYSLAE